MRRARFKTLDNGTCFGEIPGLSGRLGQRNPPPRLCREVLQEFLEEWLVLKIRDNDPIPRLGRIGIIVQSCVSDGETDRAKN